MPEMSQRQASEVRTPDVRTVDNQPAGADLEQRVGKFLREMAHELGNLAFPLQMILDLQGYSQQLSPEELRDALQGHMAELRTITRRLQRIGRCTSAHFEPQPELVQVSEVIESAIADCRSVLEERRLTVQIEPADSVHVVRADPELLQLAIAELLENAARFSPSGGSIDITIAPQDQTLEIQVRDHGPGVPSHLQARVFDLFVHGAPRLDFASGRLGVGLTIVDRVAVAHGGQAKLRHSSNDGSEFVVTLPAVE